MSLRVDTSSLIAGALVCGNRGLGVLGSEVPSSGDNGAGYLYNDLTLPADASKEVCGRITTWPSAGTLVAYEDSSFEFSGAADGTYTFQYQLYVDGVATGSPATVYLQVGSPDATFAVTTEDAVSAGAALVSPTATLAVDTDAAVFFGGAGVSSVAGLGVVLDAATFAGQAASGASASIGALLDDAAATFGAAGVIACSIEAVTEGCQMAGVVVGGALAVIPAARSGVRVLQTTSRRAALSTGVRRNN